MRIFLLCTIMLFLIPPFFLVSEGNPTLAILDVYGQKVEKTKTEIVYNYIIDKINKSGQFTIVERVMLEKALEEMELSNSMIADEETASQIGKIAGARYLLISSLTLEDDIYYLAMRVVETETAKIRNTSIKNTENFKNVEQLTEEGIRALLELKSAQQTEEPTGNVLTGNGYFFDDSGNNGNSKITRGMYLNNRLILEGQVLGKYEFGYIAGAIALSEESRNKCRKAEGITFRVAGDDNYYLVKVKTSQVTDYSFYYTKFFAPSKETVVQVLFEELHQPTWGKRVKFARDSITCIEFSPMHQPVLPVHLEVDNINIIKKGAGQKKSNPQKITYTRFYYSDDTCPGDSQFTRQIWEDTIGMKGKVTTKCPYAFLASGIALDDKSKALRSKTKGITFYIRGDGKDYRIQFITPSLIKDTGWYNKVVTTSSGWTKVIILFSDLEQPGWSKKAKFDKNDIVRLVIFTIGKPHESVYVEMADPEWILY